MANVGYYLWSVLQEGFVFGILFWVITLITVESTSLWGAVRSALAAEAVGNLTYLAGISATDPPSILMTVIAAAIFVRLILGVGELTPGKAIYGTTMTYFMLVALVTCNA